MIRNEKGRELSMTTISRKGQLICTTAEEKKKTITVGNMDAAATDANTAAALNAIGGLQKHTIEELRVVDTKVISQ